jgi:hypothetical protein
MWWGGFSSRKRATSAALSPSPPPTDRSPQPPSVSSADCWSSGSSKTSACFGLRRTDDPVVRPPEARGADSPAPGEAEDAPVPEAAGSDCGPDGRGPEAPGPGVSGPEARGSEAEAVLMAPEYGDSGPRPDDFPSADLSRPPPVAQGDTDEGMATDHARTDVTGLRVGHAQVTGPALSGRCPRSGGRCPRRWMCAGAARRPGDRCSRLRRGTRGR